jgi:hypothetical protein
MRPRIALGLKALAKGTTCDMALLCGRVGRTRGHMNYAVKHGLVPRANLYPRCSASWFETNARLGLMKTVYSFKTDRVRVPDDF